MTDGPLPSYPSQRHPFNYPFRGGSVDGDVGNKFGVFGVNRPSPATNLGSKGRRAFDLRSVEVVETRKKDVLL